MGNHVTVDETICKGCALCNVACPKKIMALDRNRLNAKGYNVSYCRDEGLCIACGMCAVMCPDSAITIEKE